MQSANPHILTINGGSSSIKAALYEVGDSLKRKLNAKIDRIGLSGTNLVYNGGKRISKNVSVLGPQITDLRRMC